MRTLLILIFMATVARAQFSSPSMNPMWFHSPSQKFRLTLSDIAVPLAYDNYADIVASVHKMDGPTPVLLWETKVVAARTHELRNTAHILLSDEGSFFLLVRQRDWTLCASNFPPQKITINNLVTGQSLIETDQLNGEPILRIWDRPARRWKAFQIKSAKPIEITRALEAQWNETVRRRILDAIQRLKNEQLRERLDSVSSQLSNLAKKAIRPVKFDEVSELDLFFLSSVRNPADRALFEDLLKNDLPVPPPPGWNAATPWKRRSILWIPDHAPPVRRDPYYFESSDPLRITMDLYLANFDQKPVPQDPYFPNRMHPINLGRVFGAIHFSTPILDSTSLIRIYLAPERSAGKNWSRDNVEIIDSQIELTKVGPTNQIAFAFGTVLPGRYSLKAIWDKRRPFEDIQKPGPGDYESDWSAPIEITAGQSLSNLVLHCTNQVAGGEAYYDADALQARRLQTPRK